MSELFERKRARERKRRSRQTRQRNDQTTESSAGLPNTARETSSHDPEQLTARSNISSISLLDFSTPRPVECMEENLSSLEPFYDQSNDEYCDPLLHATPELSLHETCDDLKGSRQRNTEDSVVHLQRAHGEAIALTDGQSIAWSTSSAEQIPTSSQEPVAEVATLFYKPDTLSILDQHASQQVLFDQPLLGPLCGKNILHILAEKGYTIEIALVIERGININETDLQGHTALHLAVRNGHNTTVELLLEKGADTEIRESFGMTALHLAAAYRHSELLVILINHGADFTSRVGPLNVEASSNAY